MPEGRGHARLGNYAFRLDPDQIHYDYTIDYATINTLGGQVIQVLGATIGDITITGSFGQDRGQTRRSSWEIAEQFHTAIKSMIDGQTLRRQGGQGPIHQPIRFTYTDGVHDWDFKVLIKGVKDAIDDGAIEHVTGKMSYHYTLTLFLVEDSSLKLQKITTDMFISRISNGLGWKRSGFNGMKGLNQAINWITKNSSDGTFAGYLENLAAGKVTTPKGTGGATQPLEAVTEGIDTNPNGKKPPSPIGGLTK